MQISKIVIMKPQWSWCPAPQHITLDKLFRPDDTFCFLAGSGISLDPPSCLPTGYQFTKALLERLIPQEEQDNILALMNPEREDMRDLGDFLRFEQLMEYLQEWYDPELHILDCYAECKTPNLNHRFLALMLTQGHPVFTTNFDSLIEYALLDTGIRHTQIMPMIHQQDWETQSEKSQYHVYKLHGSLMDIRNDQDSRQSLQATLAQIARAEGEMFQLEPWKRHIFQLLLQQYDVVVLGYSGLDDFDILPTLWTIPTSQRLLWISHDSELSPPRARIEMVQISDTPLDSYSDRIGQNLLQFALYRTRQFDNLVRITVNTSQLITWLWKKYLSSPIFDSSFSPCPDVVISLPDQLMLSPGEQWFLTGKIFDDRHQFLQGLRAYQTTLKLDQAIDNRDNKIRQGVCLSNIGGILYSLGQLDSALKHFQQALEIDEELGNLEGKSTILINIGQLFYNQGHVDEALEHFQQALQISEQIDDLQGKAVTLDNIGHLLEFKGHVDEALEHFQQALQITEQIGDLETKIECLNSIGQFYKVRGYVDEALEYFQQALQIAEQIGELPRKSRTLNLIGHLFHDQGLYDLTLEKYAELLLITEQLGEVQGKIAALNNIGQLLRDQGHLDEALEYHQQALQIAEQLGEMESKSNILANIGQLFKIKEELNEALEYYQQALQIDEQLNNLSEKASDLNDIGTIFYEQGNLDEAHKYYQQALQINEQLSDLRGIVNSLTGIANILVHQGQINKALEYYQNVLQIDKKTGNLEGLAITLTNIGSTIKGTGHPDEALEYFQQALSIAKQLKNPYVIKQIEYNIKMAQSGKKRKLSRFFKKNQQEK
ncbi:MAG: tetratricopeptide repeat protein [Promethearchaeota archaeon]